MKMEQRLFLNRINVKSAWVGVGHRVQRPAPIDLVSAMAAVAGREDAVVGAQLALHIVAELEVVRGFLHPPTLLPERPNLITRSTAPEHAGERDLLASLPEQVPRHPANTSGTRQPGDTVTDRFPPRHGSLRRAQQCGVKSVLSLRPHRFHHRIHRFLRIAR